MFLFPGFLEIRFFEKKYAIAPPFIRHSTFDRAEIFSADIRDTLGCLLFFILKNIVLLSFSRSHKTRTIPKKYAFLGCSSYFDLFFRKERDRKKPKKVGTLKCL